MNNIKKNLAHGEGNRVADGAALLQEGNDPGDHAHVKRATPLATKTEELKNARQYQDGAIDVKRETSTSRKRADKETRPL